MPENQNNRSDLPSPIDLHLDLPLRDPKVSTEARIHRVVAMSEVPVDEGRPPKSTLGDVVKPMEITVMPHTGETPELPVPVIPTEVDAEQRMSVAAAKAIVRERPRQERADKKYDGPAHRGRESRHSFTFGNGAHVDQRGKSLKIEL